MIAEAGTGRRRLPVRARGPRDRHRPQAAGLRAAGRRPRHRRRQPRARPARRRPRLRHRRGDPPRPRRRERRAADEQPGQDVQPGGRRHHRSPAGCPSSPTSTTTTRPTCAPSRSAWATASNPTSERRPPRRLRYRRARGIAVRNGAGSHRRNSSTPGVRHERRHDPDVEGLRRRDHRPARPRSPTPSPSSATAASAPSSCPTTAATSTASSPSATSCAPSPRTAPARSVAPSPR